MGAEKDAWRVRARGLRAAMPAQDRAEASRHVVRRVLALPEVGAARAVHVFWPLPGEVDLRPLIDALAGRGVTVALPVVVGPRALAHRQYVGAEALVEGPWGLREPGPDAADVDPAALDVVLVPGLAFGRDGSRLGAGGGYYDAFLLGTPALRVGVCVAAALADAVPTEPHDVPVDVVVTDAETVRV